MVRVCGSVAAGCVGVTRLVGVCGSVAVCVLLGVVV